MCDEESHLLWLNAGRDIGYLSVLGGEDQSLGRVRFLGGSSTDSPTPPHGNFCAYEDTLGTNKMLVGFHWNGDEDQVRQHYMTLETPGIYRNASRMITAVVVSRRIGVRLSIASQPALQQEAADVYARVLAQMNTVGTMKHGFHWLHPGRSCQYLFITEQLQVIYVSDKDYISISEPHGFALYYASDPELWAIHFHHMGLASLPDVQPTLLARLSFPGVLDTMNMLFRAVGTAGKKNPKEMHFVPSEEMKFWHIVMRQIK
jgi:hypothetical protein